MTWRRIYAEHRRLVLPLALVLATNLAVLVLAVIPLQTSVATAQTRAAEARLQLAQVRLLDKQATDARASRQRAESQLSKFYADVLPPDLPTATKATNLWLEQAAEDAGLQYRGTHFDYAEVRDSHLTRAFSKITLVGHYPNIRRFLYAVESAKEFIIVEKVEVAEQGEQPSANGMLEVSLAVSTYFLTRPRS